MSSDKNPCTLLLLLMCLAGCKTNGPSAPDANSSANSSSPVNAGSSVGPSQDDIQKSLMQDLPPYINQHCKGDKQALVDSLKSIRYKLQTNELINDFHTSRVVRSYGTLSWGLYDKAIGVDPAVGSRLVVIMNNEGAADPDRTIKWRFNGFGPYSDMLEAFSPAKHVGVTCEGGLY